MIIFVKNIKNEDEKNNVIRSSYPYPNFQFGYVRIGLIYLTLELDGIGFIDYFFQFTKYLYQMNLFHLKIVIKVQFIFIIQI